MPRKPKSQNTIEAFRRQLSPVHGPIRVKPISDAQKKRYGPAITALEP
jgi:hypothetical protein